MENGNEHIYMYRKNRRMGVIEKSIIMYVNCHGRIIHINTPYISVDHNGTPLA